MMTGFFAHWNKNANVAAAFDRWFLNLFPHPADHPFVFNEGGYATLNFVPSIATMLFGVLAGELLRSRPEPRRQAPDVAGGRGGVLGARPGPRRQRSAPSSSGSGPRRGSSPRRAGPAGCWRRSTP